MDDPSLPTVDDPSLPTIYDPSLDWLYFPDFYLNNLAKLNRLLGRLHPKTTISHGFCVPKENQTCAFKETVYFLLPKENVSVEDMFHELMDIVYDASSSARKTGKDFQEDYYFTMRTESRYCEDLMEELDSMIMK